MEAKILPADVCSFGRFSPAAVSSAECRFDSGVKWWIYVLSIITYLCKNSFLLHWNSCKQLFELSTGCCFWSTMSKRSTHCFLISSTPLLSHATSIYDRPKWVCDVFWCFPGQLPNLSNLSIQHHLCLCITMFKISIPLLNRCFQWSRVRITIIESLLCLNSIFPIRNNALSMHEIQIFPLFWKFATVASLE